LFWISFDFLLDILLVLPYKNIVIYIIWKGFTSWKILSISSWTVEVVILKVFLISNLLSQLVLLVFTIKTLPFKVFLFFCTNFLNFWLLCNKTVSGCFLYKRLLYCNCSFVGWVHEKRERNHQIAADEKN
jgi:hypothetical protein